MLAVVVLLCVFSAVISTVNEDWRDNIVALSNLDEDPLYLLNKLHSGNHLAAEQIENGNSRDAAQVAIDFATTVGLDTVGQFLPLAATCMSFALAMLGFDDEPDLEAFRVQILNEVKGLISQALIEEQLADAMSALQGGINTVYINGVSNTTLAIWDAFGPQVFGPCWGQSGVGTVSCLDYEKAGAVYIMLTWSMTHISLSLDYAANQGALGNDAEARSQLSKTKAIGDQYVDKLNSAYNNFKLNRGNDVDAAVNAMGGRPGSRYCSLQSPPIDTYGGDEVDVSAEGFACHGYPTQVSTSMSDGCTWMDNEYASCANQYVSDLQQNIARVEAAVVDFSHSYTV